MRKNIITTITLSVLFLFVAKAQDAPTKITFDKKIEEFGEKYQNDPVQTVFTFTNTSDVPVKLMRVKASCGCTTPSYTSEAVQPGETGEINVRYNSARVGPFYKSVTVTYDSVEKPIVLYIKGNVQKKEQETNFNFTQGGLAFDKISQGGGEIERDGVKMLEFKAKNISPIPITIEGSEHSKGFTVQYEPAQLTPGQISHIKVFITGPDFGKGGDFEEVVKLITNEEENNTKEITINGTMALSQAEIEAQPHIEWANISYEGGKAIEGEKITYAYKFTNTGKQDLIIESVKASCGCTATEPKEKVIKPGMSSEIVATFNSSGRVGKQYKTITVKTNDPQQPVTQLKLAVEVERNPFQLENKDASPFANPGGNQ